MALGHEAAGVVEALGAGVDDLKKGDHLMTCESCGRFLYYNPPVRVEMRLKTALDRNPSTPPCAP